MFFTVAICTWKRSGLLQRTLGRLADVDTAGLDWELLIVDNADDQATLGVVDAAAHRLPIRCLVEPRAGLSHARNAAAHAARGAWIAWTDDDVLVDRGWLRGHPPMVKPLLVANYDFVLGGGEVGLVLLVRDLLSRGCAPVVAVPGARRLVGMGDERPIPPSIPAGAAALGRLARDCDLVHVFSNRSALMAILARTGRPLVAHALVAAPDPYDGIVASFADAVVCNSRATARRFARDRARVIYNGVPAPAATSARLDLRPGHRTIGVIGNLCPRKGQLDVMPALERVLAARDDIDVVFAGHAVGPVAMALRDRAAASGGRVRVLGFVPDIATQLHALSLVLVPSRSEGFGRVAVEALRAGVPVLATRVEGLLEALQDHADPWLPDDRDLWPARILRELETPRHSADALRAAARRFDPARYIDDVLALYQEVLGAGGASRAPVT